MVKLRSNLRCLCVRICEVNKVEIKSLGDFGTTQNPEFKQDWAMSWYGGMAGFMFAFFTMRN